MNTNFCINCGLLKSTIDACKTSCTNHKQHSFGKKGTKIQPEKQWEKKFDIASSQIGLDGEQIDEMRQLFRTLLSLHHEADVEKKIKQELEYILTHASGGGNWRRIIIERIALAKLNEKENNKE